MTKQELIEKLDGLGLEDDEKRADVACALIGHSRIQTACSGYFHCARCQDQVGDNLASVYDAQKVVIVGHACGTCRANFEDCTWQDKFMVSDPFKQDKAA